MSSTFNCVITGMNVSEENFERWKKITKARATPMIPAYNKLIKRYGANNLEEYFEIIKTNLINNTIDELKQRYDNIKTVEMNTNLIKEKELIQKKLEKSKHTINDNIQIRMLTDADEKDAVKLYILFKETMGEDTEKALDYTQDFILKNIMFGIFVNNEFAGFVIIKYERSFRIDISPKTKIPTFYIQELLIDPLYRGNKLSKHLLEYCIYRCPKDKNYISLMTMPTNIPLIKIAESCGFIIQSVPSGDKQHSLLLIRNMDKTERLSSPKSPSDSPSYSKI